MQQAPVSSDGTSSTPLVSVVIPTLDRPDYLRAALGSVVGQSYAAIEIIVQDNASTDDPAEIVRSFDDARIRYFRNALRVNQTENVISACRRARGPYVAVLCDDDLWHPHFLREMVAPLAANSDIVVAFCDHDIIDEAGRRDESATARATRIFRRHQLRPGIHQPFDDIAVVYRSIPTLSAAVLRRAAIAWDAIPLDLPYGVDLYLAYVAARTKMACWYQPQRLAQIRYHAGTVSTGLRQMEHQIAGARIARTYWASFSRDGDMARNRRYFRMKAGQNTAVIILALWRCGRRREAMDEFLRSWAAGLLPLWMPVVHLLYAIRLGRVRA